MKRSNSGVGVFESALEHVEDIFEHKLLECLLFNISSETQFPNI